MRTLLYLACLTLYFQFYSDAFAQLKDGYTCISPDKECVVIIKDAFAFISKDAGAPQKVMILPVVYNVVWSDDSKLLLLVQHISRGTIGGIVHQKNGNWILNQIEAPVTFRCVYSIIHARFEHSKILLTYRVARIDGSPASNICDFRYDVSDGTTSEVHLKPIFNKDNIGDVFSK